MELVVGLGNVGIFSVETVGISAFVFALLTKYMNADKLYVLFACSYFC